MFLSLSYFVLFAATDTSIDCHEFGDYVVPQTPSELLNLLNVAMSVELSTLPLYMTAVLSFKDEIPSNYSEQAQSAKDQIYGVMMDEMLHMALLSNIISSVFGSDQISVCYNISFGDDSVLPAFIRSDLSNIALMPYSKDLLWTFIQIEAPSKLIHEHEPIILSDGSKHFPFEPLANSNSVTLTFLREDAVNSIGELYDAIEGGLILLSTMNEISFTVDTDEHIQRECQFHGLHSNITQKAIVSLDDALSAINLIRIQGEGYELTEDIFSAVADNIDNDEDVGNDIHNLKVTSSDKTHFIKYIELLVGRKLQSLQNVNLTEHHMTFEFVFADGSKKRTDSQQPYLFDYDAAIYSADNFVQSADDSMFNVYYQQMLHQLTDGLRAGDIFSSGSVSSMFALQQKFKECMENGVFPTFAVDCPPPPIPQII